ncbi:MAG: MFS transporter [Frankia sp.]|nr:MFS transporter [Frankia sp.]
MTLTGDTGFKFGGGRWRIPRSRGALTGLLLMILGAWGAIIPFVGPAANFGFGGTQTWSWTAARFWLEVLPGIACFVGGLLLAVSANRGTAMVGAWLAIAAGVWFIIGPTLAGPWSLGNLGTPMGGSGKQAVTWLAFFYALGAAILYLASTAQGRLSVRSLRDIEHAQLRAQRKLAARGGRKPGLLGGGRGRREAERERVGAASGRDDRSAADAEVYPSDTARAQEAERTRSGAHRGASTGGFGERIRSLIGGGRHQEPHR